MRKIEHEKDDIKWLEERMLKESEDIKVPESLEPDKMLEKLRGVEQKHPNYGWKKSAVVAAFLVLVAGVSLQTGRMIERGEEKKKLVVEVQESQGVNSEMPDKTSDVKPTKESAVLNETTSKPVKAKVPNHTNKSHKNHVTEGMESTEKKDKKIPVSKPRSFVEGDGKRFVTDGKTIYSGEGKDIVIQEYTSNKLTELARLTVDQITKDFYLFSNQLVCISSNQSQTTVSTYDVASQGELQEKSSYSVEGDYQCSYEDNDNVYVFTDAGNIQKLDVSSGENSAFSVEEKDAKYFMAGDLVYTLKKSDKGTSIQSYQLEADELQAVGSAECNVLIDDIIDIQGSDSKLELLAAEADGVRLQQYDQQMRLVNDKKNNLGEQVFAGEFTDNGILVLCNDTSRIQLSMLHENNLETKNSVALDNVESVSIGDLTLNEEGSKVGFVTRSSELNDKTYCLYNYSDNSGFSEIGTKQVEVEKVENEFVIGDSVLLSDNQGVEVLLD